MKKLMQLIVYILVYPIIWFISIFPFKLLYILSDVISFLLYYTIGYRKKIVLNNLKIAFPNKSEKELKKIRRKFYRHFVDVFMEMIKFFTISEASINKHYTYSNLELFDQIYKNGKSLVLVGSHYANWEWVISLGNFIDYEPYGGYTKINNKYFDAKILKSRSKFGGNIILASKIASKIKENHQKNIQSLFGLLSDQSPQLEKTRYWGDFFGVRVPVHTGAELLAKKYDMNIVLIKTKKLKRGYYNTSFELITDNAAKYPDYELTDIFLRKTEEHICEQPEYYFWTHNRFKHRETE